MQNSWSCVIDAVCDSYVCSIHLQIHLIFCPIQVLKQVRPVIQPYPQGRLWQREGRRERGGGGRGQGEGGEGREEEL